MVRGRPMLLNDEDACVDAANGELLMSLYLGRLGLRFRDPRPPRPLAEEDDQRGDRLGRALCMHADAAVVLVPHPSHDAEVAGPPHRRVAETHPLHRAASARAHRGRLGIRTPSSRHRVSIPAVDGEAVEVAFVRDSGEAEIVRALLEERGIHSLLQPVGVVGTQVGTGFAPRTTQRVMVNPDRADEARRIIDEALGEGERYAEPETANSRYLARAAGRRGPRNYSLLGAYARAVFWSLAAFALFAAVFLLLRL